MESLRNGTYTAKLLMNSLPLFDVKSISNPITVAEQEKVIG